MQIMLLVFEFQIYRFIFLHIFKKHVHQKLVCYSLTMRKIVLLMYISINTEKLFLLKIWPTLLKYHISKDVYVFYKLFLYRIVFHLHCTYFICIVLFCHLYLFILSFSDKDWNVLQTLCKSWFSNYFDTSAVFLL